MFPGSYFPKTYFPGTYFPPAAISIVVEEDDGFSGYHDIRRRRKRLREERESLGAIKLLLAQRNVKWRV